MLRFTSVLLAMCFLMVSSMVSAKPTQQNIERNNIEGGDNSVNVIAQGSSRVLIIREREGVREVLAHRTLEELRRDKPKLIDQARQTLPKQALWLVEELALANYFFEQGQYSLSASLYESLLGEFDLRDTGYNAVEGFTTASYFGSGRHVQGLNFICKQYSMRPFWSHRFRHDIHAHLRALTLKFSHEYARKVLAKLREQEACRRDDFSEVWIPIDLGDMRRIENAVLFENYHYGFGSEKDRLFAEKLLQSGEHHFLDYLHFVKGDYPAIIQNYPKSYVYDLALLSQILSSKEVDEVSNLIEKYEGRYELPQSQMASVVRSVASALLSNNSAEALQIFVDKYKHYLFYVDHSVSLGGFDYWRGNQLVAFTAFSKDRLLHYEKFLQSADFTSIVKSLIYHNQHFEKLLGKNYVIPEGSSQALFSHNMSKLSVSCKSSWKPCIDQTLIESLIAFFQTAERAFSTNNMDSLMDFSNVVKQCGDAREFLKEGTLSTDHTNLCSDILALVNGVSFHKLASSYFETVYKAGESKNHKALFLAALSDKHNGDYKPFLNKLMTYVFDNPRMEYADDALTEIGWYYLVIEENYPKADREFEKVIRDYKGSNAYDNALNWLVISHKNQGKYIDAFAYESQLYLTVASERIKRSIAGRRETVRYIASNVHGDGSTILVGTSWKNNYAWNRPAPTGFWGSNSSSAIVTHCAMGNACPLQVGATLKSVNGIEVIDSDEFYIELIKAAKYRATKVHIVFTLPSKRWKSLETSVQLSNFGIKAAKPIAKL